MRRRANHAAPTLLLLLLVAGCACGAPYLGSEVGVLRELAHDVRGTVFAVDDRTIYIKGFSYDGQGPDAFFWGGSSSKPDSSGFIIPDEKGKKTPLRAYRDEDLLLRLPAGKTLRDLKWIAVWCRKFTANFGDVTLPPDLQIPAPSEVGPLAPLEHGVSSGPVMVVDTHTLLVPDFTYDGKGPAAYFWASRGARQHPRGVRLADENGSLSPLSAYTGKTLVISLPSEFSVHDFDWFGVWCDEAAADFGSVRLPASLTVPPSPRTLGIELEYKLNCEVLRDDLGFEVRWIMDGEDIVLQMVAKLERQPLGPPYTKTANRGDYMSFGLSKNDSHSAMEKADAIVAWMDKRGKGHAVDYHLATKEQCVGRRGSCPDTRLSGGRDSVTLLNAAEVNGYTMVTVKRPQVGMDDAYDQHVYSDGPQAVVWAMGPLNDKGEVSYHGGIRSEGDIYIDFARSPQWNCPQPADPPTETPPPPPPTTQRPTHKPTYTNRSPTPSKKPLPSTKRPASTHRGPSSTHRSPASTHRGPASTHRSPAPSQTRHASSPVKGWSIPPIVCPSDKTLRFQVGPSGGKNGFQAITGTVGWGLSWYVNGLLLPEITLERGQSYTFVVEGGNDPENPARTHPLYLTDDPEGGLEHKTPAERKKVRVLAGVSEDRRGKLTATAKGRMCEYRLPDHLEADSFPTFDAFQENLELRCERGRPGRFTFRPDSRTPDTVYYQCFSHRHIGWKIRVVDSCDGLRPSASVQHLSNVTYNSASDFRRAPPTEKRRHFHPTTTALPAHPATMEAFHLGDVVRPQKYSSRQPQVAELKDALHWWNARAGIFKGQQDHVAAASHQAPRQHQASGDQTHNRHQGPQKNHPGTIHPGQQKNYPRQQNHGTIQQGPQKNRGSVHQGSQKKKNSMIPVLLLSSSPKGRRGGGGESPLVPLVMDKSGRHVISLLGGGGRGDIRVIRVRRDHEGHSHEGHSHEDHDHSHDSKKSGGRGVMTASSLFFLPLLLFLSL